MKKILGIMIVFFLCFSTVQAETIDDGVPAGTPEQVKMNMRAMVNAGIPGEKAVEMTRMMIRNRFQNRNILQAQQTVIDAVEADLPATPLMNKLREGLAKNIPEEKVIQAMARTRERYALAYGYARGFAKNPDSINAMGNALAQGLSAGMQKADIDRTIRQLKNRKQNMTQTDAEALAQESALGLKTLARYGVPSENAADAVCDRLKRQLSVQEMKHLRQAYPAETPIAAKARYSAAAQGSSGSSGANGSAGSGGSGDSSGSGSSGGSDGSGSSGGSGNK